MHIPNSMLQGAICPITAVISACGIFFAGIRSFFTGEKPSAGRFAAITALIFALQMMNFPIKDGTSGHLLGGVMAAYLLGVPFGILSVALVVTIQCLVFSDGGFTVLGANILNMAILGAGIGGVLQLVLSKKAEGHKGLEMTGVGIAAWFSVLVASFACTLELAIAGSAAFSEIVGPMMSTHALIGVGEGLITVAFVLAIGKEKEAEASPVKPVVLPFMAAGVIALMLSPFASGYPDGLEWVAEKYSFLHDAAPTFVTPLSDYSATFISNESIATGFAGITGVIITFAVAWLVAKTINVTKTSANG